MFKKKPFKKNNTILILILIVLAFFVKGVFWSSLFPIFQGPDEQLHYASSQFLGQSQNSQLLPLSQEKKKHNPADIKSYNFSDELIVAAELTRFTDVKSNDKNTQNFDNGYTASDEQQFLQLDFEKKITMEGPTKPSFTSVIHRLNGPVERIFSDSSIFTRVFLMRLVSLVFGCGAILVGYLIFLEVGLKKKHSLLLTSVVSFQPMLTMSASTINYDIIFIFSFALFSLASIKLLEKEFHWKNFVLFAFSFFLALYSKGTGLIVIPASIFLIIYLLFQTNRKISFYKKSAILVFIILFVSIIFLFVFPDNKINSMLRMGSSNEFSSIPASLSEYSQRTLNLDQFLRTSTSYWGNFGWLDSNLPNNLIIFISFFELVGFIAFLVFITLGKSKNFLSVNKKPLLFLLFLIVLLQLGIRFWDWKFFYEHANIGVGTPGRYFLPNIASHFLFVAIGFGFLLRKETYFNLFLKLALIFSVLLFFYSTFLVLIPRYYL
jgi:hypothetical protein